MLFVKHADGRPTGDAFVLFPSDKVRNEMFVKFKEKIQQIGLELVQRKARNPCEISIFEFLTLSYHQMVLKHVAAQ